MSGHFLSIKHVMLVTSALICVLIQGVQYVEICLFIGPLPVHYLSHFPWLPFSFSLHAISFERNLNLIHFTIPGCHGTNAHHGRVWWQQDKIRTVHTQTDFGPYSAFSPPSDQEHLPATPLPVYTEQQVVTEEAQNKTSDDTNHQDATNVDTTQQMTQLTDALRKKGFPMWMDFRKKESS